MDAIKGLKNALVYFRHFLLPPFLFNLNGGEMNFEETKQFEYFSL
jgi:hypothetical protein